MTSMLPVMLTGSYVYAMDAAYLYL